MKVELKLSPELTEAYAVIHAPALTEEIRRLLDLFSAKQSLLATDARERTVLLRPADIYMVQVEDGRTNSKRTPPANASTNGKHCSATDSCAYPKAPSSI